MKIIKGIKSIPVTIIERAKRTPIEMTYHGKYFFLNGTFLPTKNMMEPAIPSATKSPIIITNTISLTSSISLFLLKKDWFWNFVLLICNSLFAIVYNVLQGTAQRFALPALGWAAERRPTGKMLRRRKRLGIAPESPASGARFVSPLFTEKKQ